MSNKQADDFPIFRDSMDEQRYEARFSLESFSGEPTVNGMPLSRFLETQTMCPKCQKWTDVKNPCCPDVK